MISFHGGKFTGRLHSLRLAASWFGSFQQFSEIQPREVKEWPSRYTFEQAADDGLAPKAVIQRLRWNTRFNRKTDTIAQAAGRISQERCEAEPLTGFRSP